MNGIQIADGFLLGSQLALDKRTVVQSYTDLENMPVNIRYIGMKVYVIDDKKYYYLKESLDTWESIALLTEDEKAKYEDYDNRIKNLDLNGQASNITLDTTNFNNNLDNTITDVQKLADKVDDLIFSSGTDTTYANALPTVNMIGNIPAGVNFATPQTMQQMWDFLFYYNPPLDSFYASYPQGVYEIGSSINTLTLTNNVTKKSNRITKIEYYKNNMLLYTNNFPNANGGMDSYTDSSIIKNTTTYYSKVYDDKSYITTDNLKYVFVYPMYIGKLDSTLVSENAIKSMTKVLAGKSNQLFDYTMTSNIFALHILQIMGY
jgi:hypothetical protein